MWLTQLEEVWNTTSRSRTVGALATIHRGIEYNERIGRDGGRFVSRTPRTGFVAGLHKVDDNIEPFIVTRIDYLDVSKEVMRGSAHTYDWSAPKLIVNANPQSRDYWKITASIDRSGLVCSQNFHAIWPGNRPSTRGSRGCAQRPSSKRLHQHQGSNKACSRWNFEGYTGPRIQQRTRGILGVISSPIRRHTQRMDKPTDGRAQSRSRMPAPDICDRR